MQERIAVVTGANAGLGYQTTRALAQKGYRVVMACRNETKAAKAREELLAEAPAAAIEVLRLDQSEPDSIRGFVDGFARRHGQLDLLVNNAGIVGLPLSRNSVGHELQMATNYLGVFALTGLLLPLFRGDAPGRIVNVGSLAHRQGKMDLDDLNWETGEYKPMGAYGRSKLAVMAWTLELDARLRAAGSPVMALSAHPGFAATEIGTNNPNPMINPQNPVGKWFQNQVRRFIPTAEEAARPTLHAACSETVHGGEYYGPGGFMEIGGAPAPAKINPKAKDAAMRERLWSLSEELTGVRYLSD